MLEIRNLSKNYNAGTVNEMCLFENFNFTVKKGEFVSIIGSNGSGKTSMLNLICGSISPESGDIFMDGRSIRKLPEYKRNKRIGRVYQNPAYGTCPNMTILENLSLADHKGKRYGLSFGTDKRRIPAYKDMLRELSLGLEEKLDTKVGALSGGQRQALSLVMSTMTPIEFLILDEHTAALDPKTADTIMQLTDRIVKEKNLTAMMVTHNLRYAVDYGTRLLMMHGGQIVMDETGEDKKRITVENILGKFNEISIECGN